MPDKLVIGCGYLGQRVAARWRDQGHRVFVTTRRPDRANALHAFGFVPVVCDVVHAASLVALPTAATVLHCVGLDRSAGVPMRTVYVDGLRNVLAAGSGRWRRLVHVSSTSVYGQEDGGWVDETAATEPTEPSGRIVLEAEEVLRKNWPSAVTLRFAGIYGPGRLLREKAIQAGQPLATDADKWLNLIQVEDGATAVLAAEARGQPGTVYNVCDDRPVPRREFYVTLARLLAAPAPTFVPPTVAEAANRRVANRRLREQLEVRLAYPDCAAGLAASLA